MNNGTDDFERRLKDSLEHYEVPFNSADWSQMERALSSGVRGWGRGRSLTTGLLVAGALLIGGTAYFLGRDNHAAPLPEATPATAVTTAAPAPHLKSGTNMPEADEAFIGTATKGRTEARDLSTGGPSANARPATNVVKESKAPREKAETMSAALPPNPGPSAKPATGTLFHASARVACPGSPVDFTVENMADNGIYLWNFGDGSFSNKANPEHSFSKAGNYQVTLSMSNEGGGSIHNKPSSDMIVVHEAPSADFDLVKQDYTGQVPTMHFANNAQGASSYHWDLGDGNTATAPQLYHVYKKKGTYHVELTVRNEAGCVDRKMKEVHIDHDITLGAPASFSPNGDGKTDTFMPDALGGLNAKFKLAVYDTAGTLLYSTSDASRPWTGRMKNQGPACPAGEYVWVVDVNEAAHPAETFTGQVRLER